MGNSSDKRSEKRRPLGQTVCFEVTVTQTEGSVNVLGEGAGVDVSSSGMSIRTKYPLQAGQIVRLLVPPSLHRQKLPVFGEVVWSRHAGGEIRTGVRFLF